MEREGEGAAESKGVRERGRKTTSVRGGIENGEDFH